MTDSADPCAAIAAELDALDSRTDAMGDTWSERGAELAHLVEQAEEQSCPQLAQRLRWEAMLAYAPTNNAALLESRKPRFTQFHPDLLDEGALDYLVTRATVTSVRLRSRVQDFLWENGGTGRRRFAVGAGAAFLNLANLEAKTATLENFGWLRVGDALVRAAELAKSARRVETVQAIADRALDLLQQLDQDGNKRYVLDMGLALYEVADVLSTDDARVVDSILTQTDAKFAAEGNYHLSRGALDVRRRFAVARKRAEDFLRVIDVAIARSYLEEGRQREAEDSNLVASIPYNQAMVLLERIGSERKFLEEARAGLRRTREAGIHEMTRITTGPMQLTAEQQATVERIVDTVASAAEPDCFRLFALHPELLVTRAQAEEAVKTRRDVAPLSDLMPRVTLRDGGQALAPHDPEEAERLRLIQMAVTLARIQEGFLLNTIVERLIRRENLGPEALVRHLQASGYISPQALPIIEVGIGRCWERDWVSALHILTPQLEELLRSILRRAGRDTMRSHRIAGVTIEEPLSQVLDQLATVIVDDGVIFMLGVVLDLYGMNLRNLFSHGLAAIGDCSIDNAARILQLYLIVCGLRPQPPESSATAKGA